MIYRCYLNHSLQSLLYQNRSQNFRELLLLVPRKGNTERLRDSRMLSPSKQRLCSRTPTMLNLPTLSLLISLLCHVSILSPLYARELVIGYYTKTCPDAESIVREVMWRAMIREPRSIASVMRLQFHDCFVNVIQHFFFLSV